MGYSVDYHGIITFKDVYINSMNEILSKIQEVFPESRIHNSSIIIDKNYFDNYPKEEILNLLNNISSLISSGNIDFESDNKDKWRFGFVNHEWYMYDGIINYINPVILFVSGGDEYEYDEEMVAGWINRFKSENPLLTEEEKTKGINEAKISLANERLWQKGSITQEQIDMHEQNMINLMEYINRLEELHFIGEK